MAAAVAAQPEPPQPEPPQPEPPQPEPARLFEIDPPVVRRSSGSETPTRASRPETSRRPSHAETVSASDRLHGVTAAATMVATADHQLDAAIAAARADGCTWREIGIAAGVPYQTLHRRYRKEERDDVTP